MRWPPSMLTHLGKSSGCPKSTAWASRRSLIYSVTPLSMKELSAVIIMFASSVFLEQLGRDGDEDFAYVQYLVNGDQKTASQRTPSDGADTNVPSMVYQADEMVMECVENIKLLLSKLTVSQF